MPLNINLQQIFLHLLNVTLLFMILYFGLYRYVKAFMEKREEHFSTLHAQAEAEKSEADELKMQYEKKLAEAEEEIHRLREEAEWEITRRRGESDREAQEKAAEIIATARESASRERERILRHAQEDISDIVTHAVKEIVMDDTQESFDEFLDAVEKE